MADSSDLPAKTRALIQLTNNLADICFDCLSGSGPRIHSIDDDIDIEQISDQLSELQDVLKKVFKVAIAEIHSPGSGLLVNQVDELLSKCTSEINAMETSLKQKSGRKRIKGPSSSSDRGAILTNLAVNTAALRSTMDTNLRIVASTGVDNTAVPINNFIDSRNSITHNVNGDQNIYNVSTINNEDPTRKDVCAWLSAPDPSSNQNDATRKRGPETGLWFVNGDLYKKWKVGTHSFAWVHGIPGSGKSVLCSTVIEDIIGYCKDNPSSALGYFYFDFTDPKKQQSSSLIRSFITQLSFAFTGFSDVLAKLRAQCQDGRQGPSTVDLMRTLKTMIECIPNVYLVVDALDECSEREDLLGLLTEITNWRLSSLHILVTSRRERNIEDGIIQLISAQVELNSDTVDADIRTYISMKLVNDSRFRFWTAEEHLEIERALMQRAQGMFRLVSCQMDLLAKCNSLRKLRKALGTLPKTLEGTYDRILINIGEEDHDDAVKLLQWLAFSARPLFLAEMAEIFAIDRDESIPRFDPDQRPREPRRILDVCSSLVVISHKNRRADDYSDPLRGMPESVYSSGMLSLAHLSVKEYLTSGRIKDASISCYNLGQKIADAALSQECLAYLLQFATVNTLKLCTEATISFGRYAAQFWIVHARSVDNLIHNNVHTLSARLFLSRDATFFNWISLFDIDNNWYINSPYTLYYASHMGLHQLVNQLLLGGTDRSALASASYEGYGSIVRLLLESGAKVYLMVGRYGSALGSASAGGHEAVLRLLLESGADIKFVGEEGWGRGLELAAHAGHTEIVRLLLEGGADVNLHSGFNGGALGSASAGGHESTVRLLLENGADINFVEKGRRWGTALELASTKGHEEIVRLLLMNGADINLADGFYGSALASASANGHASIVGLLLESGADVNLPGGEYGSALAAAAAARGQEAVVRLLLDSGADVNLLGGEHGSALALASYEGHTKTVRLLLEHGANINFPGGKYGSALGSASRGGWAEVVDLLLESGADVNLAGGIFGSALLSAMAPSYGINRWEEQTRANVVQLLLEHGADVTFRDQNGRSAVMLASEQSDYEIVQLLLQYGADAAEIVEKDTGSSDMHQSE